MPRKVRRTVTEPSVWISQMKDRVSYGVKDAGRPGKRTSQRAMAEFLRVKHFVEVELVEMTEKNRSELLKKSVETK